MLGLRLLEFPNEDANLCNIYNDYYKQLNFECDKLLKIGEILLEESHRNSNKLKDFCKVLNSRGVKYVLNYNGGKIDKISEDLILEQDIWKIFLQ